MIQDMVESELQSIVEEYNPISASIIVSNPETGYVLLWVMYRISIRINLTNQITANRETVHWLMFTNLVRPLKS